jgi:uncharacterized protein (TIGR00251 family)
MKLMQTSNGVVLEIRVKPRSDRFEIQQNDEVIVFCKEAPVKGRVNRTVEKELSRLFKSKVDIVSGFSSRKKRVLIENASVEEVARVLAAL